MAERRSSEGTSSKGGIPHRISHITSVSEYTSVLSATPMKLRTHVVTVKLKIKSVPV